MPKTKGNLSTIKVNRFDFQELIQRGIIFFQNASSRKHTYIIFSTITSSPLRTELYLFIRAINWCLDLKYCFVFWNSILFPRHLFLISCLPTPVLIRGAHSRIRSWGCTHSAARRRIVVPRWQKVVLGEYWFYLQGENSCTTLEKSSLPRKPPPTVVDEKSKINFWRLFTITICNF